MPTVRSVTALSMAAMYVAIPIACASATAEVPESRGGGPQTSTASVEDAVAALSGAACERERRCGYRGRETECRKSFESYAMQRLSVCNSRRVVPMELFACLESIRASDCESDVMAGCPYVSLCAP